MKKWVSAFVLFFAFSFCWAQSPELDSLRAQINKATVDSVKLMYTIRYASELIYTDADEARMILDESLAKSRKIGYKAGEANALYSQAVGYAMEGKYEPSLKRMIQASSIYQQIGNNLGYAKCLGGQGNIYYFMDNLAKAQEYYEEALEIYRKERNDVGIASCLGNLGLICHQTQQFNKALKYQKEGLDLEIKAENKRGIAISHISIASLLLEMKRFPEAKSHALKSIQYSKELADTNSTSDGMIRLAEVYRLTGVFDSAQFYLNDAIRICEKVNDLHQLVYALTIQSQLYDTIGNFYNAYQTQKKLLAVKDSILNKEKTAQLVEMQTKFETERKEKENQLLLARNSNQRLILLGLITLFLLSCIIIYQTIRSRKKIRDSHEKLLLLHNEVQQQKEEIETIADNLIKANEAITIQKDLIESSHHKISDSLVYASFIQSAMLPPIEQLYNFSTESFIIFQPRDIVSGDFYWYKEKDGHYLFAVADCTGHGVPGALLSMMGISFLNDIVASVSKIDVAEILNELRNNVKQALGQFSNKSLRKEGIEIGLISYNPESHTIDFSGAYLSLWLFRENQLTEYKSDKMPIGISLKESPFTSKQLKIEKGDIIYLFTDGYADQIGGLQGKKFLRRNFLVELQKNGNKPLSEQQNIFELLHREWRGTKFDQIDDVLVAGIKF